MRSGLELKHYIILEDEEQVDEFYGTAAQFAEYFDEHYSGGNFDYYEA